ncbi:MAG: hypothetical protein RL457_1329 [Pseudomonadota bacterium]
MQTLTITPNQNALLEMAEHIWEIANQVGLSNVLKHEIKWEDGVQNVMPNLDILTSGSVPEHPVSLLDSPFMKAFINNVSLF